MLDELPTRPCPCPHHRDVLVGATVDDNRGVMDDSRIGKNNSRIWTNDGRIGTNDNRVMLAVV